MSPAEPARPRGKSDAGSVDVERARRKLDNLAASVTAARSVLADVEKQIADVSRSLAGHDGDGMCASCEERRRA